jgi:hypothetical protein
MNANRESVVIEEPALPGCSLRTRGFSWLWLPLRYILGGLVGSGMAGEA